MDGDAAPPVFLTVADKVKAVPTAGLPTLTLGVSTTRFGSSSRTVTLTDKEQLFVVPDSPVTSSTQAP